jgi:hypothetical protein
MIVPGGGISLDDQRWVSCRPGFFLPVRVLSRLFRYRMHTSLLRKLPETDSLVGVGFAEGGIMSMEIGLGRFGDRRLEKGGPLYTRRWFDGLVRASDASQGTEHGRFGSRVFCATIG